MDDKVYDEPSEVEADKGRVSVAGPDGVSVLLTPEAAMEISDRLMESAADAQGQLVERERKAKRLVTDKEA